jgi:hypothetical protein
MLRAAATTSGLVLLLFDGWTRHSDKTQEGTYRGKSGSEAVRFQGTNLGLGLRATCIYVVPCVPCYCVERMWSYIVLRRWACGLGQRQQVHCQRASKEREREGEKETAGCGAWHPPRKLSAAHGLRCDAAALRRCTHTTHSSFSAHTHHTIHISQGKARPAKQPVAARSSP